MIHVALPDVASPRRLPFYLAMEEWVASHLPQGEYFFVWSVKPTVICGRHQDIPAEVDLGYCRSMGIDVVRRKSGGGCVYADLDNLMLSYISPDTDAQRAFGAYTAMVAASLRALDLDAEASGRNDVLIDGRKVSGGAFLRLPGRSIAHSTMLVSTNFENMLHAITPDRSKLESHRVKSVQSRITTLKEHLPSLTVHELACHLISTLTDREITLSPSQVAEIEEMEKGYYSPQWLQLDASPPARGQYIQGVGTVRADVRIADGAIERIALKGDFFSPSDPAEILARCVGLPLDLARLEAALSGIDTAIPGLSPRALAEIIANQ
ncbi:MAG: hypothetical protein NC102_00125 [Clostridium sp.]|nr:hypothetical protein [Clostridium sp.]